MPTDPSLPSSIDIRSLRKVHAYYCAWICYHEDRVSKAGSPHDSPEAWTESREGEYMALYLSEALGMIVHISGPGGLGETELLSFLAEAKRRAQQAAVNVSKLEFDEGKRLICEYQCEEKAYSVLPQMIRHALDGHPLPQRVSEVRPKNFERVCARKTAEALNLYRARLSEAEAQKALIDAVTRGGKVGDLTLQLPGWLSDRGAIHVHLPGSILEIKYRLVPKEPQKA